MARYNCDDVRETARLFNKLLPMQPEVLGWAGRTDLRGRWAWSSAGIPMDEEALEYTHDSFAETRDQIRKELLHDLPPSFNLNSADHVAAYLYLKEFDIPGRVRKAEDPPPAFRVTKEGRVWTHGKYTVEGLALQPGAWTDSGSRPKADAKTLAVRYGSHPWVSRYLEYQTLNKLIGTYLEAFPKYLHGGRLYGTFNQAGTVSGRLSSSEPNLQNQPRRGSYGTSMRRLFKGNLIIADFSQLEPRIAAHLSQDPEMLRVFTSGDDIYKSVGAGAFGIKYWEVDEEQREVAKQLVLSMNYGAQARKVAEILSLAGFHTTQKEAKLYLARVHERFPRFFEWREEVIEGSKGDGFVTTMAGRKRHIGYTGTESAWKAERQAVNSVIQGSAADIVNATMVEVAQVAGVQILIQVHDELVCEYMQGMDTQRT